MTEPFENLRVGAVLCDMHDGFDFKYSIKEPVKVLSHHRLTLSGGCDFIKKSLNLPHYVNKHLVLAGYADYRDEKWYAHAIYSYDDMVFGTVYLEVG